ncbi:ABC1 kinase family protein [Streptomyces sp. NPDC014882]|uniref:ABC1 kinase family protein n=1 Tax=Streptomyces sp. NPDC014882 TaxID=3364927 RepID=UPI0036FFF63D
MTAFVIALTAVGTIALGLAVLGLGARRLLGLRIGALRFLLTGCTGLLTTGLVSSAMGPTAAGTVLVTVQVGSALLAAMIFLALSEAVVPSGSVGGIVRWPRSVRRRVARTQRFTELSRIALRHGLGRLPRLSGLSGPATSATRAEHARALRTAFEEAGTTFVKLGQVLSTRYDLLPAEFIDELGLLQCAAAAEPWDAVEQVLTEDLGAPPGEVFAEFDTVPLAAGSVAQVHRARLRDGRAVAVKVQRPRARQVVERDLDILLRIARRAGERTAWGRSVGVTGLVRGFAASLREELDFRTEARNTREIAAREADARETDAGRHPSEGPAPRPAVGIPAVHDGLTTARVLVVEWLDGVTLDRAAESADARGVDRTALAGALLDCVLAQIMTDGVFHADPHPGNIMLLDDGRPGLLDFGCVGRIDRVLRSALRDLLVAIHRNDPQALCDALLELVEHRPEPADENRLARDLGRFMARHLVPGTRPDRDMFAALFALVTRYGLVVPGEIAAVFRSLSTLEVSLGLLVPDYDIIAEARRFAASQVRRKLTPGSLGRAAAEEMLTLLPVLRRLPRRVDRITEALEQGRLSVNVRVLADERDRDFVRGIVHDILLAFSGGAAGVVGVMLLQTPGGPEITSSVGLFEALGCNLLLVASVLTLRVLFSLSRGRR